MKFKKSTAHSPKMTQSMGQLTIVLVVVRVFVATEGALHAAVDEVRPRAGPQADRPAELLCRAATLVIIIRIRIDISITVQVWRPMPLYSR
jgi:hypothetical protein